MKKGKLKAIILATVIMTGAFASIANATTISTSEFGSFTYSLTKSGSTVTAKTSITKLNSTNRVYTTLEVQDNSTGETIFNEPLSGSQSATVVARNLMGSTLAAFSSHEARGNTSIVRYLASTF